IGLADGSTGTLHGCPHSVEKRIEIERIGAFKGAHKHCDTTAASPGSMLLGTGRRGLGAGCIWLVGGCAEPALASQDDQYGSYEARSPDQVTRWLASYVKLLGSYLGSLGGEFYPKIACRESGADRVT